MKSKLSKWQGQFLVDHKIVDNLEAVNLKQGEKFKIKLLAKRGRVDEKKN
jgi:hypothetical protein